MRAGWVAFLLVGFGIGFLAVYPWMRQQATELARPIPVFTRQSAGTLSPPPLDTARLQQLEQAVSSNPNNFEALTELGNIHFEQENYPQAVEWYQKALALQPGNISVRTDMGGALFYAGRIDESIAAFDKSLEIDPAHPQALFNLGVAYLEGKQDPERALEAWERLVAMNPDFPQVDIVKQQIQRLREQSR